MRDQHRVGAWRDHDAHVLAAVRRGPHDEIAGPGRAPRNAPAAVEHRSRVRGLPRVIAAAGVRVRSARPAVAERREGGAVGRERQRASLPERAQPDRAVLRVADLSAVLAAPERPVDDALPDGPLGPASLSRRARRLAKAAGSGFSPDRIAFSCGPKVLYAAFCGNPSSHFARSTAPAVSSPYSPSDAPGVERAERIPPSSCCAASTSGPVTCGFASWSTRGPTSHDDPAAGLQLPEQHGGAALLRDRRRREPPVGDVLPLRVVVREAPQVRRVDARVMVAVAPAVVALELVERARDAPVLPLRRTPGSGARRLRSAPT